MLCSFGWGIVIVLVSHRNTSVISSPLLSFSNVCIHSAQLRSSSSSFQRCNPELITSSFHSPQSRLGCWRNHTWLIRRSLDNLFASACHQTSLNDNIPHAIITHLHILFTWLYLIIRNKMMKWMLVYQRIRLKCVGCKSI